MSKTIPVGVIGLGRSGYHIHCKAFEKMPETYRIAAVTDADAGRRAEVASEYSARDHASIDSLLADPEIELVVVSSHNNTHAPHAVAALKAGKNVVCEKPFGLVVADVDAMLAASKQSGKIVVPFQNRRYERSYQRVRQVIEAGTLGRIVHIRMHMHGFGRRWDWQTLTQFGGGQLNNNGPHMVDQALGLYEALGFDDVEALEVWSDLRTTLSTGDAEDHVRVTLRAPDGGPTLDLELFATTPYPMDKWLIAGTAGGLCGSTTHLEWKWVDWLEMPERPATGVSTPDRSYNREDLNWRTETWDGVDSMDDLHGRFYGDLFRTLREGAALVVTPESVRPRIRLLEKIRAAAGR